MGSDALMKWFADSNAVRRMPEQMIMLFALPFEMASRMR